MGDDGVVRYVSIGVASTAQSVDENMQVVRKITAGERVPILFDAREWPKGDPASWARFISVVEGVCTAAGVVASPTSEKALGRFPEFIDDLVIPFRVFHDEDAALEFLRQQI